MNKIYLPNLNSLRAIAASMVIVSHLQGNSRLGVALGSLGALGVTIFFVLSGFLITYLLLVEQQNFDSIKTTDFYIRRALRIWPLYFLILLFAYLVFPLLFPGYSKNHSGRFTVSSVLLNVFFLTNFTLILKMTPLIIRVIWSIGIEEQFYVFWPWIMKLKQSIRNKVIILLIVSIPLLKFTFIVLHKTIGDEVYKTISSILTVTRFDCMAIGGVFGILAFSKKIQVLKYTIQLESLFGKNIQIFFYGSAFLLFMITSYYPSLFNVINFFINPWIFAFCILNLAMNEKSIFQIENRIMNYLGKISFGLYLIHQLVIYFLMDLIAPFLKSVSPTIFSIFMYFSTFLITILLASLSYEFYEKRFIKLKLKFSHVKT